MNYAHPSATSASVRNILTLLASRDAQLVAGSAGLERRVTWASRMRARLPAFDIVQGGELALLTLTQLRRLDETLPHLLKTLHKAGVAAVAVAAASLGSLDADSVQISNQLQLPLIYLPAGTILDEIEREVIAFVVNFRGEVERKATEIAQQLMQLSAQGQGIQGICEYLAQTRNKWVVLEDEHHHQRLQIPPPQQDLLALPPLLTDDWLSTQGLACVMEPVQIRQEIVAYLSLLGKENDFDYLERLILSQVTPILALELVRERERTEVESRYHVEALTDVLQGRYQQAAEMIARARLLGYDLNQPHMLVIVQAVQMRDHRDGLQRYQPWFRRVREEFLRTWADCWMLQEPNGVVALIPAKDEAGFEEDLLQRLERVRKRIDTGHVEKIRYSIGVGRLAPTVETIPRSLREARQALEIGNELRGIEKVHLFSRLGLYRLLFFLDDQPELMEFYQEILGPLLANEGRQDTMLLETLESYFRYNGNLSETARAMHLHRNSLLYRLNRIETLLGQSLEDSELRLNLQVALKIHRMKQRHA